MSISRRGFLKRTAAATAGITAAAAIAPRLHGAAASNPGVEFRSAWDKAHDRVWPGPEYWANPQQDWRVKDGRLECVTAAVDRNVHVLTHQLGEKSGELKMAVKLGRLEGTLAKGAGSVGFRVGIMGPLREYRNSLVFGRGLDAGLLSDGRLFIGGMDGAGDKVDLNRDAVELRLEAKAQGEAYRLVLSAHDANSGAALGQTARDNVAAERLVGNIALVANYQFAAPGDPAGKAKKKKAAGAPGGNGQFWFADWRVGGSKVEAHPEQTFGPILFSHYTLSGGVLKLTAQMPPMGAKESQAVELHVQQNGAWKKIAEEKIHAEARTATFRVANWNDATDMPYRIAYQQVFNDGRTEENYWTGTVRRDPKDRPVLTIGDVSCNIHEAFPNVLYTANMARLNPDLLAFVGDQFYEGSGGYNVQRTPLEAAILDYLRKWSLHGWTWRELTRDRPSLSLPDDHDVYQGNLWGEGGAARKTTQEAGGYDMDATWVNVVHRTQAAHHPDPYDATPGLRNTSVYYGPMVYGRVSFAVLSDRQFKNGPEGKVPPASSNRGDHVDDPNWKPKSSDVPGLQLIGERQLKFLREWVKDWNGAEMKAVISQTIFTAMATTHGANRERLIADYDTNAWPQTQRNAILREMRRVFAVHIAGDQHLPAVVHYGIEKHHDGPVAFTGPAVNTGYPRWFEPKEPGVNRKPGAPENTGDFKDHFGHPLTVLAVANGEIAPRKTVMEKLHDKVSGIGFVRIDKANRTIEFEAWPLLADPLKPGTQFPGWPVVIPMLDNYRVVPAAHLPALTFTGVSSPVVRVTEEKTGELVYALRAQGNSFQPHVFAPGKYTVHVSEPETRREVEVSALEAEPGNAKRIAVAL